MGAYTQAKQYASSLGVPMNIIGISGLHNSVPFRKKMLPNLSQRQYRIVQGLDSAAALITDDGIQAAAAEERFTGEKGTGAFPIHAIQYCLRSAHLTLADIDYIAHGFFYEPYRSLFEHDKHLYRQLEEVFSRESLLHLLGEL